MNNLIEHISHCVEFGKVNQHAPYPQDMKGKAGAYELTAQAIKGGIL